MFSGGLRTLTTQVDPNAKLIYNDNKVEGAGLPNGRSAKADAMYEMLKGEIERDGQRGGKRGKEASRTEGTPRLFVLFARPLDPREMSSLVALPSFIIRT